MTPSKELIDPELVLLDNLFEAREVALNFTPTANRERSSSAQADRLARCTHDVLMLHFSEEGGFVRDDELADGQPNQSTASILDVLVVVDSFQDLLAQRKASRQMIYSTPSAA